MPCSPEMPISPLGPWWRKEKNGLISCLQPIMAHSNIFTKLQEVCTCPQSLPQVGEEVQLKPAYDGSWLLLMSKLVFDGHILVCCWSS